MSEATLTTAPAVSAARTRFEGWWATLKAPMPPAHTALWLGWRAGWKAGVAESALYEVWARATDPGLSDAAARELIVAAARAALAKTEVV